MASLAAGTYPAYFEKYISKVDSTTPKEAIEKYAETVNNFFKEIPEEKHLYKYAEGKWTIKEVLQHIIDAERIFSYRALRIARKDKTPLPGFDENAYADAANNTNSRDWQDLIEEFIIVRKASDLLIKSFTDEQFQQVGTTSNNPTSVEAISYIMYGHILHHIQVLKERYLDK